jgi:hypothetical protein
VSVRREPPLASYHEHDDATRVKAVRAIVEAEMACPDDHWNDDYRTRPDAAWTTSYHDDADAISFCGRPNDNDTDKWIATYIEAEDQVIELRRGGHSRARAILDLPNEIAYACDDCGLWSHVEHIDPKDAWSVEARSGALFDVRDCDIKNLHRIHGRRITADEAWAREEGSIVASRIEESSNGRTRDRRKAAEYAFYYRLKKKEAKRETTTS